MSLLSSLRLDGRNGIAELRLTVYAFKNMLNSLLVAYVVVVKFISKYVVPDLTDRVK